MKHTLGLFMTVKNLVRQAAINDGQNWYISTIPCKKCGAYEKYVKNYGCKPCYIKRGLENLDNEKLMAPYRTKEKALNKLRKWRNENTDKYKAQKLRAYNLTIEQFENMLQEQNGKCAICNEENSNNSDLCVDHNHTTEIVRGLLCRRCNMGLGYFKDDIELMKSGIEYLEKYDS